MDFINDYNLAPLTSWKVGGPADYICFPESTEDIQSAMDKANEKKWPITVLGGGSNVLISDNGVRGLVICLQKLTGLKEKIQDDQILLEVMAGTAKSALLRVFLKHRLEPALFLAGLPGDVGGGVVMNAGVGEMIRPREFVEIVQWVDVVRNENGRSHVHRFSATDLEWTYRHCRGWQPGIICQVGLAWPMDSKDEIRNEVKAANKRRLSKQPLDMPSCGSTFVNPEGDKAGRLIESCQLKGFKVGGAKISEKHANFIVNVGGASANDIAEIINHVQATVMQKTGAQLRTEVVFLGDWKN